MESRQKAAIVAALFATIVSALAATSIVGREVRAVEVLALFAGGFGSGAAVAVAVVAGKAARARAAGSATPDDATRGSSGES